MVTHIKLEGGQLRPFDADGNLSGPVAAITGRLECVLGENGKTCFVFQDAGGDWIRLYLDLNRKPVSRLLLLLCSHLGQIRDAQITVSSDNTHGEGQSRLVASILAADGSELEGFAPFDLPRGHADLNGERISAVMTALGRVVETGEDAGSGNEEETGNEEPADGSAQESPQESAQEASEGDGATSEEVTAGDLRDDTPRVIDGLGSGEGVPVERQRVVTVEGFPVAVVIYSNPCDMTYGEYRASGIGAEVLHGTYRTKGARDAFVSGVRMAVNALKPSKRILTVTEPADLADLLGNEFAAGGAQEA